MRPTDPPPDGGGTGAAARKLWEEAQRRAVARWEAARAAWYAEHGHGSVESAAALPDEPFDAEVGDAHVKVLRRSRA